MVQGLADQNAEADGNNHEVGVTRTAVRVVQGLAGPNAEADENTNEVVTRTAGD